MGSSSKIVAAAKPSPEQADSRGFEQRPLQNLRRTAILLALATAAFASALSWYSWTDEQGESIRNLTTVVELEAKAIDSYLSHLERELKSLAEDLSSQGERIDLDRAYALVRKFKELRPELFNVTLIRPDGQVLLTARNPPGTTNATLANESSFTRFLDELRQGKALGIGQPLVSVVSKVVIVPVRYAIRNSQGIPIYIVSANLPQEHLRSFWMDAPITDTAAIGLMRDNGYLLSRYPVPASLSPEQVYGQPRTGALINYLQQQRFPQQGYIRGPSSLDGPDFLNAFRRLPNYPLTLFVAMPLAEIRAAWWKRTQATYLALAALCIGGFVTYRSALRRQIAWDGERTRLQESQRESENKFRLMADSAPVLVWIAASDKLYFWFNKVWLDFTGRSMAQELGNGWTEGVHPDDLQRCLACYVDHFDRRQPFSMDYRLRRHDGEYRWITDQGLPRFDEQGQFAGYIGSCVDITERKRLEQALDERNRELTTILDNSTIGIIYVKDRVLIWVNRCMAEIFGYKLEDMVGKSTRMLYFSQAEFEDVGKEGYGVLAEGKRYTLENVMRRQDGSAIWTRRSGQAINPNNSADGSIWVFEDINHQKELERDLIQAKDSAEAANMAKSRFLATMSHEIRTPMNGILGMAQLLIQPQLDEEERVDYARTVLNSGQALLTLLNDILDLSKIEAGRLELETAAFDPQQVLNEIYTLFSESARNKRLRIDASWRGPAQQRYLGDALRLRQMLSNLVSNAIKFTERGAVRIDAAEIERQGDLALLEFAVTDTGVGIAKEKQPTLFKAFAQADSSTSRKFGGTGLGLSIVQELARLMNGEVGIDSEAGTGSRFWFRIRLGLQGQDAESRRVSRQEYQDYGVALVSPGLSGRVLVIEDNLTNQKVIEAILGKFGISVDKAKDGLQGSDMILHGLAPDLILMDIHMPVMDGFEATRRIRRWEQENNRPPLPIVALTADAYDESRQQCAEAGMDGFLPKPIAIDNLRTALGKWLAALGQREPGADA